MDNYQNPMPGKTYISPALTSFGDKSRLIRIASKVLPSVDGYEYVRERDEAVLRHKPEAATYISAKFLEDTRRIKVLTVQKFSSESGQPYGSGFSFVGEEIVRFCEFLANIQAVAFESGSQINISDSELRRISLTSVQAKQLVTENEDLIAEVVKNSLTKQDVVAIGYRKKQLKVFKSLLEDDDYFQKLQSGKDCTSEALWQKFFEKNPWIFGYGLSYIYASGLDGKKLEQAVRGNDVAQPGKRVDALLKTKAWASSLCFVEIKTHKTRLLKNKSYREGCWAPSEELAGAVAQVQGTVALAAETLKESVRLNDDNGFPTAEEVFNYSPRAFVVVGSLEQFVGEHGVNREQLRSFELFRRNTIQPEIVTYDELFERAKHIIAANEA